MQIGNGVSESRSFKGEKTEKRRNLDGCALTLAQRIGQAVQALATVFTREARREILRETVFL